MHIVVELSCVSFVLISIILFKVLQAYKKKKILFFLFFVFFVFSYELTYGNSNEHLC